MERIALGMVACLFALQASAKAGALDVVPESSRSTPIVFDQLHDISFYQFSSSTFALQVLQTKNNFAHDDIVVGGAVQLDAQNWHGNQIAAYPSNPYNDDKGLYFTAANVELMANIHPWITGFFALQDSYIGGGSTNGNYIYFPQAFFLFGNLNAFPAYLTVGINAIPFGVFAGNGPWDTPLTASYFYPSQAPQVSIGYYKNGLNATITEFKDEVNYAYHAVENINYQSTLGDFTYTMGGGYLSNLQSNSAGQPNTARTRRTVLPVENMGDIIDANASVQYSVATLSVEFAKGTQTVLENRHQPRAFAIAAALTPDISGVATTFALTYSKSMDLNLVPSALTGDDALPYALVGLNSLWSLGVSRPVISKNFVVGLEMQKATTYDSLKTYTGTLDFMIYV